MQTRALPVIILSAVYAACSSSVVIGSASSGGAGESAGLDDGLADVNGADQGGRIVDEMDGHSADNNGNGGSMTRVGVGGAGGKASEWSGRGTATGGRMLAGQGGIVGDGSEKAGVDRTDSGAVASYSGCSYRTLDHVDHLVISKCDPARGLAFNLVLNPLAASRTGLTLPDGWGMEYSALGFVPECPSRIVVPYTPMEVAGKVVARDLVGIVPGLPGHVDVDVTLEFDVDAGLPSMENLAMENLNLAQQCRLN